MIQVEEITDLDAFLALEAAWGELCRRSGIDSFFLSHAWFRCCWVSRSEEARPIVLLVREGGALLGIAPFFLSTTSWRIFPVRAATLMQSQDSPFADVIVGSERAGEVLRAMVDHLVRRSRCDIVMFNKMPCSSPTHALLRTSTITAPHVRTRSGRAPILALEGNWQEFWTGQSQRFKKTVRNVANRVEKLGRITVEDLAAADSAEECLRVFVNTARTSWKATLPTSPCNNPRIGRFFELLTTLLHGRGRLRLWVLRVDGAPVATEYHVSDGDTVYALRSDFDDRYREASPGAYLNEQIVRVYFAEDVRTYDMGPGERAYKQRWASGGKDFDDFSFFSRRPYPLTVYSLEEHAVPRLRRARDWWRAEDSATPPACPDAAR